MTGLAAPDRPLHRQTSHCEAFALASQRL